MTDRVDELEGIIRQVYREVELAVREATLVVGHDGMVSSARKLGQLVGRPDDEFLGQPPVPHGWTLLDENCEPIDAAQHPVELARRTGLTETAVVGLVDPEGHTSWLRIAAHPVTDDLLVAVDAAVEHRDRRPLSRARMEGQERRFETMAELLPVAVYEASATGEITYVNPAFMRLTGYESAEAVPDLPILQIVHPDDLPIVMEAASRAPEEQAYQARYRVRHLDGTSRWVSSRMSILVDSEGTVSGFVGAIEDVDDLQRAEREARDRQDELEHNARHDSLTGLANRSALDDRIASARADGVNPVVVFFADVDRFKAINDSGGHEAGDKVLVEVGRRLSSAVRENDLLVRMGGDEFVGWCAAPREPSGIERLAERLVSVISAHPITVGDQTFDVRISVGLATSDGEGLEHLLSRADQALYRAKRAGRNCWMVDPTPPQSCNGHGV